MTATIVRIPVDYSARMNNAKSCLVEAILRECLQHPGTELSDIAQEPYYYIDYTARSPYPGLDGKPQQGRVSKVDFAKRHSIVSRVCAMSGTVPGKLAILCDMYQQAAALAELPASEANYNELMELRERLKLYENGVNTIF